MLFTQFTVDQSKLTVNGSVLSDTPNVRYLVALFFILAKPSEYDKQTQHSHTIDYPTVPQRRDKENTHTHTHNHCKETSSLSRPIQKIAQLEKIPELLNIYHRRNVGFKLLYLESKCSDFL